MAVYLIRRLALLIPTMLLLTIAVFFSIRIMPGSVIDTIVGEMGTANQGAGVNREELASRLGLDVPVYVQYGRWIKGIITEGELGRSLRSNQSLTSTLLSKIPITFELGLISLIITNLIAIPLGIYSAIRQDTWLDYFGRSTAIMLLAVPAFWLASLIIVFGSRYWGWSPAAEYIPFTKNPLGNIGILLLPSFLLGMSSAGGLMRMIRTITLDVMRQDYIRTAWAKGLKERVVVMRHGIRNAMIPLVTIMIPQLGALVGGSVIMEQMFNIPGMGRFLLQSLLQREYLIVSGTNLIYSVFFMLTILITDLSYAWLDPRIRYK